MSPASAESLTTYPAKKSEIAKQLATSEQKTEERAIKKRGTRYLKKPLTTRKPSPEQRQKVAKYGEPFGRLGRLQPKLVGR